MTTTAHPLRILVDHGDGRSPAYELELDAQAEIVGCGPAPAAAGRGPFGPSIEVTVVEPVQPSGATKTVAFIVAPTIEPATLPGWTPTALGYVDGHTVAQVEPCTT